MSPTHAGVAAARLANWNLNRLVCFLLKIHVDHVELVSKSFQPNLCSARRRRNVTERHVKIRLTLCLDEVRCDCVGVAEILHLNGAKRNQDLN